MLHGIFHDIINDEFGAIEWEKKMAGYTLHCAFGDLWKLEILAVLKQLNLYSSLRGNDY